MSWPCRRRVSDSGTQHDGGISYTLFVFDAMVITTANFVCKSCVQLFRSTTSASFNGVMLWRPQNGSLCHSIPLPVFASFLIWIASSSFSNICRRPLHGPCKCSGSIGLTHQDCLMSWLEVTRGDGKYRYIQKRSRIGHSRVFSSLSFRSHFFIAALPSFLR